jgi:hypothetical protein
MRFRICYGGKIENSDEVTALAVQRIHEVALIYDYQLPILTSKGLIMPTLTRK